MDVVLSLSHQNRLFFYLRRILGYTMPTVVFKPHIPSELVALAFWPGQEKGISVKGRVAGYL